MFQKNTRGVIVCLLLALPAWILGHLFPLIGSPVFAIVIGMVIGYFHHNRRHTADGIAFTSKYILQVAVVLLGFGLNLTQVLKVGVQSLPIIFATVVTSLLIAFILQKLWFLDVTTATLIGVGSSICGGSAIAATAPVIDAKDEEIAKSISVIFLFNILAALLFPTFGDFIHLSNHGFALFAGTAVNDTSSVTATATAWDMVHKSNTLGSATIVKLTRTLAIIPITLGLSLYKAYQKSQNSHKDMYKTFQLKKTFPMFVFYFLLASIVSTIISGFGIELSLFNAFKILSKFLIVMAMVAIGLNTNPVKLIKTGGQAISVGAICWIAITCVSLLMQHFLGIW